MADEATTPEGDITTETPSGESTDTTTDTTNQDPPDYKSLYEAEKSHKRNWEKKAKSNAAAEAKLKEIEDAQKSEAEKSAERLTTAEKAAQTASLETARLRVAIRKGLTETQARRLIGDDEEALEKDADELLASFKSDTKDDTSNNRRPKERLRSGATPSAEPDEMDPKKLAAEVSTGW